MLLLLCGLVCVGVVGAAVAVGGNDFVRAIVAAVIGGGVRIVVVGVVLVVVVGGGVV